MLCFVEGQDVTNGAHLRWCTAGISLVLLKELALRGGEGREKIVKQEVSIYKDAS
jgi:hypothetical protein